MSSPGKSAHTGRYRQRVEDLLFPRTDGGVAVQVAIAVAALIGLNLFARAKPKEVRLFSIGLSILTIALLGVRAVH